MERQGHLGTRCTAGPTAPVARRLSPCHGCCDAQGLGISKRPVAARPARSPHLMVGLDEVAMDVDAWRDGGVQWGVIGVYCLAAFHHVNASSSARCGRRTPEPEASGG